MPLPILLYWQALGWIAFGLLEPWISERTGTPTNSGLVLSVGIAMAVVTATLGSFLIYYRATTSQGDLTLKPKVIHKCLNCGHTFPAGVATCPSCGSQTLF